MFIIKTSSLNVQGRAHYLSITEASHKNESLRVSGEEDLCFMKPDNHAERWRARELRRDR